MTVPRITDVCYGTLMYQQYHARKPLAVGQLNNTTLLH